MRTPSKTAASMLVAGMIAFLAGTPGVAGANTINSCSGIYTPGLGGSYAFSCTIGELRDYTAAVRCNNSGKPTLPATWYYAPGWANAPAVSFAQCPSHLYSVGYGDLH